MENKPLKAKYNLKIDNIDISVITDTTPDLVAKFSKELGDRISIIRLSGADVTSTKAAVLIALDLLDENYKLKAENAELRKKAL